MVFQSERDPANPFFQIFLLDFEFGDVTPVSPGHGKTTCAWVHPNNRLVMYASTQDDPAAKEKQRKELEFRESGQTKRYSWDYDENYEIYSFDVESKKYQRLTNATGYDAEGSYSPDGKLVAFASNRNAYSKPMTEEQKKAFEVDPAVMMDIFVMNSDGTNVKQLTTAMGYDGGPFFSPDGKRICWRRFAENGATAEVMTMNVDGSDQKQITKLGAMSWAPFYHSTGKYLIFTTNKHGFANFELYMVDAEGKSTPVRVTETKGFDGLASFSPDGKKLTWTTNRNEKKQSQIYLADWNHEQAMKLLKINAQASTEELDAANQGNETATKTSTGFEARDVMRHVDYLCRKELGGRMTGSMGEKQATAYVAAYLDNLGVIPNGDAGSWYQEFEFPAGAKLGLDNRLSQGAETFEADKQWRPLSFSKTGEIEPADVVFVGYGIKAESTDEQEAYDSYSLSDVNGKWVMMFRYLPEDVDEKRRAFLAENSSLRKKAMVARDQGAVGIIVVSGPNSNVKNQLVDLKNDLSSGEISIAAISVTDELADSWTPQFRLKSLQALLDSGMEQNAPAMKVGNGKLAANIAVEQLVGRGRNVVGRMLAGEKTSDEAIIVGAHIDHLGSGTNGSLAKSDEKNAIHFGADDNASGVVAMLEIAEYLAELKRKGKLNMKRDIVFAAWSGEELGLHGSQHFVNEVIGAKSKNSKSESDQIELVPYSGDPHNLNDLARYYEQFIANFDTSKHTPQQLALLKSNLGDINIVLKLIASPAANPSGRNDETIELYKPLATAAKNKIALAETSSANATDATTQSSAQPQQPQPIAACLNMDMVGRMEEKVVLQGIGSSNDWNRIIEKANVVVGLPIEPSDDTRLPTDASSFYRAGVPILSAFTGSHNDYHTPRDTPEKLNYPDAARIARLMGLVTRELSINESTPTYIKQTEAKSKRVASTGRRARLGTIPNYTEKVAGVLLDDVEPGGPASEAGLKGGDTIIELAGKKIENIYDYQYAIDSLKVGKETGVSVMRDSKRVDLRITPGSRD